ncbi:MAG: IS21 family transposase, partial [Desulfobacteraceae bacterium]
MEVWHTIQVWPRQGRSMRSIARELGNSRNTVKRYGDNQIPPRYVRQSPGRRLDHYVDRIQAMRAQKFIGTRIFHELRQLGYTGSLTSVYRYLNQLPP